MKAPKDAGEFSPVEQLTLSITRSALDQVEGGADPQAIGSAFISAGAFILATSFSPEAARRMFLAAADELIPRRQFDA